MKDYFKIYVKKRPLFLSVIRSAEVLLYKKYLPFKEPILDFGCGDGFFSKVAFGKITVGIDIDQKKLKMAEAEKIYRKLFLTDGEKLPFRDKSFSTVVANCVFEHIFELDLNLSEINRVLKPGGKLYCTVMADNWEKYIFLKRWMRRKQKHYHLLSVNNWRSVFMKNGFKVEKAIGYLDRFSSLIIEILHFFSLDSLINFSLNHEWKSIFPWDKILSVKIKKTKLSKSAALFFVLSR